MWLIFCFIIIGLFLLLAIGTYLTNPFNNYSIIQRYYLVESLSPTIIKNSLSRLRARQSLPWLYFSILKCGLHIIRTRYLPTKRSKSQSVSAIIQEIKQLRFDPKHLLLITGEHFNGLFTRNLGVFYYPTLDPRIPDSDINWEHRQKLYLQSTAYALGVYSKHPVPTTTIVETGPYSGTCVNFYSYPSDTVYGLFYALAAMLNHEQSAPTAYAKALHKLQTQEAAQSLVSEYETVLIRLLENYQATVFNDETGLIRTNIHISGAKDITKRRSAFYDNVIYWKTTQLAMTLGIVPEDKAFLKSLKARILATFWLKEGGYFLEDLSQEATTGSFYSSDWLIVLATGFLSITKPNERKYYENSVDYIIRNEIDQPFPLRYQKETRGQRQFLLVRLAAASYGGEAIWSFWGMEYIKTLLLLYEQTGLSKYLSLADTHIATYKKLIKQHGGFPEVYNDQGGMLQTLIYQSVRMSGWVIGFEQVLAIRRSLVHPYKTNRAKDRIRN